MLRTPWGDADALEEQKLPPDGGRREAARREQRRRLFAATVAACARRGYADTSVEDLLELSGVSRGTFYKHFSDKLACFRAMEEEAVSEATDRLAESVAAAGSAGNRAREGLRAVLELCADQPDAARVCLVESYAAGRSGGEPIAPAMERLIAFAGESFRAIPGREEMPLEMARAIVGGWYQVIHRHLREHREAELPGLDEELWRWAMSYRPPLQPLRRPTTRGYVELGTAPSFAAYSPEQRIIRAFARVVAEKGFHATTISNVVAAASISQTTFYQYFADKTDLLTAALESSGAQMMAATLPSARRAPDSLTAVRVGIEACCFFLSVERDFAWLRNVAVYSAGPAAIAIRNRSGSQLFTAVLDPVDPLLERLPELPPVALEATVGAVYGVLYNETLGGRTAHLPDATPLLTYLALAPVAGAERAVAVATAGPALRGN